MNNFMCNENNSLKSQIIKIRIYIIEEAIILSGKSYIPKPYSNITFKNLKELKLKHAKTLELYDFHTS